MPTVALASHFFPLSLDVHEVASRPVLGVGPSQSAGSRQRDLSAIRDSERAKREYEALTSRWTDLLMDSSSVERAMLRKAADHLQPGHYREITHERHLNESCSYPTCAREPRRPYSSAPRYKLTRNRAGRSRDVEEISGNPDDGYCSPECRARSIWYERNLSEEPVWARSQSSDPAAGQEANGTTSSVMLEDLEDRGEVIWTAAGEIKIVKPKDRPGKHRVPVKSDRPNALAGPATLPSSKPSPQPLLATAPVSTPPQPPRKSDKPPSSFPAPILDSLRIIERPTVATTLGKEGLAKIDPAKLEVPEPPDLRRAKIYQDGIGKKATSGWSTGSPPAIKSVSSLKRTDHLLTHPAAKPAASPAPNPAVQARLLSSRRRAFGSSSSTVSTSLLGLPEDANNVADFSRVMAGASKAGLENAKGREKLHSAFQGGPGARAFGDAADRAEEAGNEDGQAIGLDEDELEESEDEDTKLAFEQAALAEEQLGEGTFF